MFFLILFPTLNTLYSFLGSWKYRNSILFRGDLKYGSLTQVGTNTLSPLRLFTQQQISINNG